MNCDLQRKYAHLVLETTPGPHNHMMAELAALIAAERRREKEMRTAMTNYWARMMNDILVRALSRRVGA